MTASPVLLVLHDFLPDVVAGTEIYALRLARALLSQRPVYLFYTRTAPDLPHGTLEHTWVEGLPVFRFIQNHPYRPLRETLSDPLVEQRFREVLETTRPGLVHFHHLQHLSLSLPALARAQGCATVMTLHDYWLLCPSGGQLVHHPDGQSCLEPLSHIGVSPDGIRLYHTMPSPDRCTPCYARYCQRSGPLETLALNLPSAIPNHPNLAFELYRKLPLELQAGIRRLNAALPRSGTDRLSDTQRREEQVRDLFFHPHHAVGHWIAPSRDLADRFLAAELPPERLSVLPNPLPEEFLGTQPEPTSRPPLPPEGPLKLLFVGTLAPHKGLHRLLEVLRHLNSESVQLQVVGDPSAFADYVSPLKAAAPAGVTWSGPKTPEEVAAVMRESHALVLASEWPENAPLTVLEALACGLPVVAPRLGGIPEQVQPGINALLYDPTVTNHKASSGLASILTQLLTPPLLQQLCEGSRHPEPRLRFATHLNHVESIYARLEASSSESGADSLSLSSLFEEAGRSVNPSIGSVPASTDPLLDPSSAVALKASIVIPTFNGGDELVALMQVILRQRTTFPFEVLIIDSSSTDDSVASALRLPAPAHVTVRLHRLPQSEFQHGRTRNLGASLTSGQFLIFTVQDALPLGTHWLQELVGRLESSTAAGGYARQVARQNADPLLKRRLAHWTPPLPSPQIQQISADQWEEMTPVERLDVSRFDNVCSVMRRESWQRRPFRELPFAEDLAWGIETVRAGQSLLYIPGSVVIHSHRRSFVENVRRARTEHTILHTLLGMQNFTDNGALLRAILSLPRHLLPPLMSAQAFQRELAELIGQVVVSKRCSEKTSAV